VREFLTESVVPETLNEAVDRIALRRSNREKTAGKMLVVVPTKGGVGVTSLAANFAIALTKESGARVVIVDLDFQLGDVALGLGMTATFSVVDAINNSARLDREFLSTLLLRYISGLAVLAAPENYTCFESRTEGGAEKRFRILRDEFDYIVVDTGICHGHIPEVRFAEADKLYLVTELTFPALRNARRLSSYLSARDGGRHLEVVLNRFNAKHADIEENSAIRAMGRLITWRIPNSYAFARAAQDTGVPLAMELSPITNALTEMAKAACGKPVAVAKKIRRGYSFFSTKPLSAAVEN